eukprot:Rmarinus@m.20428
MSDSDCSSEADVRTTTLGAFLSDITGGWSGYVTKAVSMVGSTLSALLDDMDEELDEDFISSDSPSCVGTFPTVIHLTPRAHEHEEIGLDQVASKIKDFSQTAGSVILYINQLVFQPNDESAPPSLMVDVGEYVGLSRISTRSLGSAAALLVIRHTTGGDRIVNSLLCMRASAVETLEEVLYRWKKAYLNEKSAAKAVHTTAAERTEQVLHEATSPILQPSYPHLHSSTVATADFLGTSPQPAITYMIHTPASSLASTPVCSPPCSPQLAGTMLQSPSRILGLPAGVTDDPVAYALRCSLPFRLQQDEWLLLYDSERDGVSLSSFYRLIEGCGPTYLLVLTKSGHRVGGFASVEWHPSEDHYIGTGECFVFRLPKALKSPSVVQAQSPVASDPKKRKALSIFDTHRNACSGASQTGTRAQLCPSNAEDTVSPVSKDVADNLHLYTWSHADENFMLAGDTFLCFGSGSSPALYLNDDFSEGSTYKCKTYKSDPLLDCPSGNFGVLCVEVWGFSSCVPTRRGKHVCLDGPSVHSSPMVDAFRGVRK